MGLSIGAVRTAWMCTGCLTSWILHLVLQHGKPVAACEISNFNIPNVRTRSATACGRVVA